MVPVASHFSIAWRAENSRDLQGIRRPSSPFVTQAYSGEQRRFTAIPAVGLANAAVLVTGPRT
jgi:hypothetical protein